MSNTDGKLYHSITSQWSTRTPADLGSCEERPGWASPSCRNQLLSRSWSLYSMFSEQSSPLAKQLGKKKNNFLKRIWLLQSSRGKEKEAGFPADICRALSAAEYPPGNIKTEQSFMSCAYSEPLYTWRNREDLAFSAVIRVHKTVFNKPKAHSR